MVTPAKRPLWSEDEIRFLLKVYKEKGIRKKLICPNTKKGSIYNCLVPILKKQGYSRSVDQIKAKLKRLKRQYVDISNYRSKTEQINCSYYDELKSIYGGSKVIKSETDFISVDDSDNNYNCNYENGNVMKTPPAIEPEIDIKVINDDEMYSSALFETPASTSSSEYLMSPFATAIYNNESTTEHTINDDETPDITFDRPREVLSPDCNQDYSQLFGDHVAAKLKSMRYEQRLISEKIISDVLFQGQMNMLQFSLQPVVIPGYTKQTIDLTIPRFSYQTQTSTQSQLNCFSLNRSTATSTATATGTTATTTSTVTSNNNTNISKNNLNGTVAGFEVPQTTTIQVPQITQILSQESLRNLKIETVSSIGNYS